MAGQLGQVRVVFGTVRHSSAQARALTSSLAFVLPSDWLAGHGGNPPGLSLLLDADERVRFVELLALGVQHEQLVVPGLAGNRD
jgi:hypothetical protein